MRKHISSVCGAGQWPPSVAQLGGEARWGATCPLQVRRQGPQGALEGGGLRIGSFSPFPEWEPEVPSRLFHQQGLCFDYLGAGSPHT